jgi:phage terminase large subunit
MFYILAMQMQDPQLFSVVSESYPHLSKGAIRDFKGPFIMGEDYSTEIHDQTNNIFYVGKSQIEFFSVDQPGKAQGPRRNHLLINEANRLKFDIADQLMIRTRGKIIIDFNPTFRFWAHDLIGKEGVWFDKSTYRDNPFIDKTIVRDIESRRNNVNWWRVFGEGEVGAIEGLVIPGYKTVQSMPNIDTEIGIDFGFTNDPTACIEAGILGDTIYLNELFYERGMTKDAIVSALRGLNVPSDYQMWGDGEDPRLIEEIRQAGYDNISAALREPGAFKTRVDFLLRYNIAVTSKSTNLIRDLNNAMWQEDPSGISNSDGTKRYLNKPEKGFLHGIDASGYAMNSYIKPPTQVWAGNR